MDRPARSLRRLPARSAKSAERSLSKGRTAKDLDTPQPRISSPRFARRTLKDSEQETIIKNATPPRKRSRSRSNARKRQEVVKDVKEVNDKDVIEKFNSRSSKTTSAAPVAKLVSKLKEGIEHVRNSVSPEVEEVVRRSLSRFEEVKTEVVSNIVTRRASSRQSRASSASVVINSLSNIASSQGKIEEEIIVSEEQNILTNHIGTQKKEKSPVPRDAKKVNYLKVFGLFLLGTALCALVIVSHFICSKDDCQLSQSNLPKALDYSQYFDSYIWPVYSLSLLLLFAGCRFTSLRQRRPQHFSVFGGIVAVLVLGLIWASHQYLGALRLLTIPPLIGAIIIHTLVLVSYAGNSSTVGSKVHLETLVHMASSILLILLSAFICAIEYSRTTPNLAVLILGGLEASIGLDNLLLPPLSLGLGPIGILWLSLRPFILVLPQTYISANKVALGTYTMIGIVSLHVISYVFYRYSSTLKNFFLRDPYSSQFSKLNICGDYIGGPWGVVRHPQLIGLLFCELSWASAVLPSLLAPVLILLSVVSTVLVARTADRRLSRTYRAKITSSLIPFIPV
ncbi:delta(14)-sterol reductase LBR [Halyomorpha halys]|uniref:delta(14)-sterol reductase LBR n=1 Tax=Halyomorpha halys TaxID=286706 RepID=UPI0006D52899|nr:uncharacterized protein LOC106685424 [Halyomorpha halys]XP_014283562.1 uncharacterized protein LOC106685424 [Halyomorpha halys]